MRKFGPLEKEVIRWIVQQSTSKMTSFDRVLSDKFFNETYKMGFLISNSVTPDIPAILYIKECDEFMARICISQFLEVVSLVKYLEENRLVNVLNVEREKSKVFINLIHKNLNLKDDYTVDDQGTFLDKVDKCIKDSNKSIVYRPIKLSNEYKEFGFKYFLNAIYPTEELRKLVERNFFTEDEEALKIAQNSLELTQNSLTLTRESLDSTRKSLELTKYAFAISVVTLFISAFSYCWSTSTIQEEQFKTMEKWNKQVIESMQINSSMLHEKLDSIKNILPSFIPIKFEQ